ncbi:cupin [Boudabousia liubingyangii]|uniref:Cupin n=1 Tax=Boudabousia liubingyangii TaxID=1921764 RepID=A0A1Q5PMW4_9ACTO|nr:cupin domain-containing protein [Boudabousia liubingyangii]OKL47441.1 cupin [Boudabousia liubingyangii]OKL48863.1 cupin [Boudabousia liubingyangii]
MLFFTKSELPVDHVDDNTDRIVMARGGSMMYAHIFFKKAEPEDATIPLHNHVHEQITYVLKGSFKFEINDEDGKHVQVVREGDSLYMPSDSRHGCIPLEDDSQLIDCFTPQREDFLK